MPGVTTPGPSSWVWYQLISAPSRSLTTAGQSYPYAAERGAVRRRSAGTGLELAAGGRTASRPQARERHQRRKPHRRAQRVDRRVARARRPARAAAPSSPARPPCAGRRARRRRTAGWSRRATSWRTRARGTNRVGQPAAGQPPGEVEVLRVHPLLGVEAADRVEGRAGARGGRRRAPSRPPRSRSGSQRRSRHSRSPSAGDDRRRARVERERQPERGKRVDRVLDRAVGDDQRRSQRRPPRDGRRPAASRVSSAPGASSMSAFAGASHGARGPRRDRVHGGAEAEVALARDELDPAEALADEVRRAVAGGVVDHPDLGAARLRVGAHRLQAPLEQLAGVPGDDGDRHLRAARSRDPLDRGGDAPR